MAKTNAPVIVIVPAELQRHIRDFEIVEAELERVKEVKKQQDERRDTILGLMIHHQIPQMEVGEKVYVRNRKLKKNAPKIDEVRGRISNVLQRSGKLTQEEADAVIEKEIYAPVSIDEVYALSIRKKKKKSTKRKAASQHDEDDDEDEGTEEE
jgi:hypothetical protein